MDPDIVILALKSENGSLKLRAERARSGAAARAPARRGHLDLETEHPSRRPALEFKQGAAKQFTHASWQLAKFERTTLRILVSVKGGRAK